MRSSRLPSWMETVERADPNKPLRSRFLLGRGNGLRRHVPMLWKTVDADVVVVPVVMVNQVKCPHSMVAE